MSDLEWVGTAWTRVLRNEAVREDVQAIGEIVTVAAWIATYADPDGENAFPSRETLHRLTGFSLERIGRAVRVLLALGLLKRKRRPNLTPTYSLMMPVGRIEWATHLHLYTETRDKQRHRMAKERTVAEALERMAHKPDGERARRPDGARTASAPALRTASAPGVPEGPDSERARYRTASAPALRTASAPGGDQAHPPSVDQSPDHTRVGLRRQAEDAHGHARDDGEEFRIWIAERRQLRASASGA